jgi:hypothetical protein
MVLVDSNVLLDVITADLIWSGNSRLECFEGEVNRLCLLHASSCDAHAGKGC